MSICCSNNKQESCNILQFYFSTFSWTEGQSSDLQWPGSHRRFLWVNVMWEEEFCQLVLKWCNPKWNCSLQRTSTSMDLQKCNMSRIALQNTTTIQSWVNDASHLLSPGTHSNWEAGRRLGLIPHHNQMDVLFLFKVHWQAPAVCTTHGTNWLPRPDSNPQNGCSCQALTPPETETGPAGTPGIIIPGSIGGTIVEIWGHK